MSDPQMNEITRKLERLTESLERTLNVVQLLAEQMGDPELTETQGRLRVQRPVTELIAEVKKRLRVA